MKEIDIFHMFIYGWFGLSAVVFFYLLFISAPYGRHERAGWGPHIRDKPGWVLMEIPAVVVFGFLFLVGAHTRSAVAIAFLFLWEFHYIYRTFIFSALLRGNETLPLVIVGLGFLFNIMNSYINGRYLFILCPEYAIGWFLDPRFMIGLAIFCAGFTIHFTSDRILRNLRRPGETEFKIPQGAACSDGFPAPTIWEKWQNGVDGRLPRGRSRDSPSSSGPFRISCRGPSAIIAGTGRPSATTQRSEGPSFPSFCKSKNQGTRKGIGYGQIPTGAEDVREPYPSNPLHPVSAACFLDLG